MEYTFNATIKVIPYEGELNSAEDAINELSFLLEEYGYFETAKAEVISIELEHNGKKVTI